MRTETLIRHSLRVCLAIGVIIVLATIYSVV